MRAEFRNPQSWKAHFRLGRGGQTWGGERDSLPSVDSENTNSVLLTSVARCGTPGGHSGGCVLDWSRAAPPGTSGLPQQHKLGSAVTRGDLVRPPRPPAAPELQQV